MCVDDETSITYYGKRTHPEICWVRPRLGSSNFGVCITELVDGLVHVLHAEEYQRPDFNQMTEDLFYSFKNGISNAFNDCAKSNLQTFFDIYYLFQYFTRHTNHEDSEEFYKVGTRQILDNFYKEGVIDFEIIAAALSNVNLTQLRLNSMIG